MKTFLGVTGVLVVVFAILGFLLSLVIGMFVPFAAVTYSDGDRTGLVNKISQKGLVCKTYEGSILVGNGQNVQPETFKFTVKDPEVVKQIEAAQGKVASLEYQQYLFSSACWGDTNYEVTGVRVI
jgi:hypothetical protein